MYIGEKIPIMKESYCFRRLHKKNSEFINQNSSDV